VSLFFIPETDYFDKIYMNSHTRIVTIVVSTIILVYSTVSIVVRSMTAPKALSVGRTVVVRRNDRPIRVALLNGCGREGLASQFASALRERGFDVLNGQGENADSFDFEKSVVVDRKGDRGLAKNVAEELGVKCVIIQHAADQYVLEDIEIIIGRDWDTLLLAKEVQPQ